MKRLAPLAGRLQGWLTVVSYGRILGDAAALLGWPSEARDYYEQALAVPRGVRFRPEIALSHLALAELLATSGPQEQPEAFEHLHSPRKSSARCTCNRASSVPSSWPNGSRA
jgi:hypothetical protein